MQRSRHRPAQCRRTSSTSAPRSVKSSPAQMLGQHSMSTCKKKRLSIDVNGRNLHVAELVTAWAAQEDGKAHSVPPRAHIPAQSKFDMSAKKRDPKTRQQHGNRSVDQPDNLCHHLDATMERTTPLQREKKQRNAFCARVALLLQDTNNLQYLASPLTCLVRPSQLSRHDGAQSDGLRAEERPPEQRSLERRLFTLQCAC